MASYSYGRVVELYVDNERFNGADFAITFSVPFDDDKEPNVAEIRIYNLKTDTINKIKKDSRVILNAGYTGDAGAILLGTAKEVKSYWSGVDRITQMQVVDGPNAWFNATIKKSYKAGSNGDAILKDLTKMTGLQIGAYKLPRNHVYKSGKAINGKLSATIAAVAKDCDAKAHVTRGKVFIRPKNEGDNIGFVLNAETGLISSPTPIEKEVVVKKRDKKVKGSKDTKATVRGWAIKCLLNHRITTDALIRVASRTANGTFRVESGTHNGDSFETEMEVYPI